jgi:hypothetical protein
VVEMVIFAVGKESRIKALTAELDFPKEAVNTALMIAFLDAVSPVIERVTLSRELVGASLSLSITAVFAVELTAPTRSTLTNVEASAVLAFTDFAILKNFCIAKL